MNIGFKCEICGKEINSSTEYNEETTDISYGFEWVVEHKSDYCKTKEERE
jgi:hypothetical protein